MKKLFIATLALVDEFNDAGGLNGQKVELIVRDDRDCNDCPPTHRVNYPYWFGRVENLNGAPTLVDYMRNKITP